MLGWAASILLLFGLIEIGNHRRSGFILSAIGAVLWALQALIMEFPSSSLFFINIFFTIVHLNNWKKWKDSP